MRNIHVSSTEAYLQSISQELYSWAVHIRASALGQRQVCHVLSVDNGSVEDQLSTVVQPSMKYSHELCAVCILSATGRADPASD